MDTYTRPLAEFAAGLEYRALPNSVVEHAKLCLLDTLGVGLFGSTLPWSRIVADCLLELEGGGASTLWGLQGKTSPAGAALVNGTMAHGFELDDLHKVSIVHPGPVVVTAALALAEHLGGVPGERFLAALVAGYEVTSRVGMSMGMAHLVQGFQPTGTHGTLGSAAAAGSLLNLSADQMQHALGIAGAQAAGLMASQYSSMVKRLIPGRAAQTGVYAGLLARRGFTGITNLLGTDYGSYCSTLSPWCDREKIVHGLGDEWEILKVGFKPYSTNASCHTSIDAILELKSQSPFGPEDVEAIRVYSTTATQKHVGWPYVPDSATTAQMNLSYILAVTITDGDAFVDQFTDERMRDEKLVALSRRVKVTADPEIDARGDDYRHAIRMEVRLKDGRVLKDERQNAKGSDAHPQTRAELERKFTRLAEKVLPAGKVGELRDLVYRVDSLADVGVLAAALVP